MRKIGLAMAPLAAVLSAALSGCASGGDAGESAVTKVDAPGGPAVEERMVMATDALHAGAEVETVEAVAPQEETTAASTQGDPLSGQYLIEAGDVLIFRSLDDETLSSSVIVRYDGNISLPLIPDLSVNRLTREEATNLVFEAYSEIFVEPQISLSIAESRSKFFTVMGDVSQPAQYPYERRITLLDAINTAGGPRINQRGGDSFVGAQGSLSKALVIRTDREGQRDVMEYDLRNLSVPGFHASQAPVYPGDIVYVPEGVNLVYVIGEVPRPDVYALAENTTLLRLLAQSGISFQTGKLRRIVLLRETDEVNTEVLLIDLEKILRTGQDFMLKPGDVLYVPRKDLIRLQQFVQRFTGSISPIISLYTQAQRAYYDKDFIDQALGGVDNNNLTSVINTLQQLNQFVQPLTP